MKRILTSAGSLALVGLLGVLLAGCRRGSGFPAFTEPPTVSANPNPAAPLVALVRFCADAPVNTSLQVSDGARTWWLAYDDSNDPEEGLPVVGMRPDRRHEIRVSISDADGKGMEAPEPLEFTTPPLPSDPAEFPPIRVTVSKPDEMEPGITLFNPRRRRLGAPKFGQSYGMLLPRDEIEKITWTNVLQFNSWTRIREYTHTTPPELVWEVVLEDTSEEDPIGWALFGGERLGSLIPFRLPGTDEYLPPVHVRREAERDAAAGWAGTKDEERDVRGGLLWRAACWDGNDRRLTIGNGAMG